MPPNDYYRYFLRWLDSWMDDPRLMGARLAIRILAGQPSSLTSNFARKEANTVTV
jgi:hypothetical protein